MKTRIISGLIMLPFLGVVYLGGTVLLAVCFIIAAVGILELYNGFKKIRIYPSINIGLFSAAALFLAGYAKVDAEYYMLWFFAVVTAGLLSLFNGKKRELPDAMATVAGIFYVAFFSFHVVLVDQKFGTIFVWLILLTAFGTDVFAYFTGLAIGKHKLCSNISPKKTIEGALGGIAGSVILCGLFACFFLDPLLIHCLIIGALGSVAAQLGDLTASIFKRNMGIKDYGSLIPGHGGMLDRFDSVLFTGPFIYYYIVLIV
jgi:phosphatidate cytidylyltransferase